MTNRSKQKGSAWERRFVDYLVEHGFPYAERRALEGTNDRGDVAGVPGVVFELKNCSHHELAAWMDEMVTEKRNAKAELGVVGFPRKSHATGRAYVLMELDQLLEMIR